MSAIAYLAKGAEQQVSVQLNFKVMPKAKGLSLLCKAFYSLPLSFSQEGKRSERVATSNQHTLRPHKKLPSTLLT